MEKTKWWEVVEREEQLEVAAARLLVNDLYILQMEGLLRTLCLGLEETKVTIPPDLLDWWAGYRNDQFIGLSVTEMMDSPTDDEV